MNFSLLKSPVLTYMTSWSYFKWGLFLMCHKINNYQNLGILIIRSSCVYFQSNRLILSMTTTQPPKTTHKSSLPPSPFDLNRFNSNMYHHSWSLNQYHTHDHAGKQCFSLICCTCFRIYNGGWSRGYPRCSSQNNTSIYGWKRCRQSSNCFFEVNLIYF